MSSLHNCTQVEHTHTHTHTQEYEKRIEDMEEAREKALQEVTDHYETKLVEREQQREQVKPCTLPLFSSHCSRSSLCVISAEISR